MKVGKEGEKVRLGGDDCFLALQEIWQRRRLNGIVSHLELIH